VSDAKVEGAYRTQDSGGLRHGRWTSVNIRGHQHDCEAGHTYTLCQKLR